MQEILSFLGFENFELPEDSPEWPAFHKLIIADIDMDEEGEKEMQSFLKAIAEIDNPKEYLFSDFSGCGYWGILKKSDWIKFNH